MTEAPQRSGELGEFVAAAPNAMAMFDRAMRYIAVSRGWVVEFGLDQALLGRSHYDVFPQIGEARRAVHRRCLAGATERSAAERFERADGRIQWVEWEARPWMDGDGAIGGIVISAHDVTALVAARREAEGLAAKLAAALESAEDGARRAEAAERRLKNAIDAIPWGFDLYDADDRLIVSNAAAEAMYPHTVAARRPGVSFEDLLRIGVELRIHGPSPPENERWLAERMERRRNPSGPIDQLTAQGRWLRIEERRMSDGGTVVIRTDVTDLKTREREHAQKSALLEAVLENIGEGIAAYRPDRTLLAVNAVAMALLRLPGDLCAPGATFDEVNRFRARRGDNGDIDDVEEFVAQRAAWFQAPQPFSRTRRLPDGRTIDTRFTPMPGGGGVFLFRDMTEWAEREARLAEKTALLEATLHTMGEGILVYDADLKLLVANEIAARLLDAPAALFQPGADYDALNRFRAARGDFGDEDLDEALRSRVALFRQRLPWSRRQRDRDGRVLEIRFHPTPEGGGVFVLLDVTAAATREAALAEKTALLEATLRNMGEGLAAFDADRRLVVVNDFALAMVDLPPELVRPGVLYDDMLRALAATDDTGGDVESFVAPRVAQFCAGQPFLIARRLADGRVIETRFTPTPGGGGVFIYRDVSERVAREAELAEKSALLEDTFQNIGEGVLVYDAGGRLLARNDLAARLLAAPGALFETGAALADLIGFRAVRGDYGEVDVDRAVRTRMAEFAAQRPFRDARRRPDGRLIEARVNPTPGGGGVFVLSDITEAAEREAKLEAALAEAERASRAKSEFLGNVSHELRTPMNAIIGLSSLLREGDLKPEERRQAQTIEAAGESLLVIINDVLEFASLDAGEDPAPDAMRFDLRALVEQTISAARAARGGSTLAFRADIAPGLPAAFEGDGGRIAKVLRNLVDNAVKHTAEGTVTVRAQSKPAERDERRLLRIEVEDTGRGFPPSEAARLFLPFERGASPDRTRAAGLGLGLAICRKHVEAMGGTIAADSTPGVGSRFWFEVPVDLASPAQVCASAAPGGVDQRRRLRVLVAEDVEANRAVIGAMLQKLGHEADFVEDGEQAIEAARANDYDAILMDIQMPNLDGLEATRVLRAIGGRLKGVPIIAVSAHSTAAETDAALRAGVSAFLSKPVRRSALDEALNSLCA
ncbi:PAS domain S-box-containing protein [Roseiarcus fermentans]|uniref:histidine kinase n=1 Tax=Roseiarcus fermentans TaxID=1473586 RepID=A0A366FQF8_9HYPH|nr:PAS-domain containing protein [Roseiarcus fermentans]RBP16923.1 PAS domain S-box-containing protein [Roseiarcus fermentans]